MKNITIYSSRGPLSAGLIEEMCTQSYSGKDLIESAGDARFLMAFLFPYLKINTLPMNGGSRKDINKKTCIVPHSQD